MSRIDDLIAKYCPNGVVYKRIEDLMYISRGRVISKDYLQEHVGDYPVYSSQTVNEGRLGSIDTYDYDGEYLTWTTDGANAGSVFYRNCKFNVTNVCGLLKLKTDDAVIKYVMYALQLVAKGYVNEGMGNPKLMSNVMAKILIPVPPKLVQEEIVKILDSFTELEAELETELEARKKQYEYYREQMLSFYEYNACVPLKKTKFGDVVKIQNGFAFKSTLFKDSGLPLLRITNIQGACVKTDDLIYVDPNDYEVDFDSFKVFPNDIVIALSGATTGKSGKNKTNMTFLLNQRVAKFIPDETQILNGYLYHLVQAKEQEFLQLAGGGAQPNLSTEQIKKMQIYIPSLLSEQERIVSILDKFDALVNDISVGLPAEIAARRKQYEYWRNKLLDFKKA